MSETRLQHTKGEAASPALFATASSVLQRKCDCGNHAMGSNCDDCAKKKSLLQRKAAYGIESSEAPSVVNEVLRSTGQPLDAATRAFMAPRFGHDFSRVRVHTDGRSDDAAHAINAKAFTLGQNIVFAAGQYQPHSPLGINLLAHELTHTIQQRDFANVAASAIPLGAHDSREEREADSTAETLGLSAPRTTIAPLIQRKTWDDLPIYEERPDIIKQTAEEADEAPKDAPAKAPAKKAKPNCTRTILAEGTCAFLVANSKYICCDPANGVERKGRDKDIDGTPCPSQKFTPIFTCDNKCDKALEKGCSDNDNWMAVPNNQFSRKQCGDIWTICANGKQTSGYVRDHSVTETRFEVSPKIQKDLGVTVGSSFKGSVYKAGASKTAIEKDTCCTS